MLWLVSEKEPRPEPEPYYKSLLTGPTYDVVRARAREKAALIEKERLHDECLDRMQAKDEKHRQKTEAAAIENSKLLKESWDGFIKVSGLHHHTDPLPPFPSDVGLRKPPKVAFQIPEGVHFFHPKEYSYDLYTNRESNVVRLNIFLDAVCNNDTKMMNFVHNAEVTHRTDFTAVHKDKFRANQTVVMDAVAFDQMDVARWYLNKPALKHVFGYTDSYGLNALNYAMGMSRPEITNELLQKYPDLLINNKAFDRAIEVGQFGLADHFIRSHPKNICVDYGKYLPITASTGCLQLVKLVWEFDNEKDFGHNHKKEAYLIAKEKGFTDVKEFIKSISPKDDGCVIC